jgi:hypothetical protein
MSAVKHAMFLSHPSHREHKCVLYKSNCTAGDIFVQHLRDCKLVLSNATGHSNVQLKVLSSERLQDELKAHAQMQVSGAASATDNMQGQQNLSMAESIKSGRTREDEEGDYKRKVGYPEFVQIST